MRNEDLLHFDGLENYIAFDISIKVQKKIKIYEFIFT